MAQRCPIAGHRVNCCVQAMALSIALAGSLAVPARFKPTPQVHKRAWRPPEKEDGHKEDCCTPRRMREMLRFPGLGLDWSGRWSGRS